MIVDVVTILPEMFEAPMRASMLGIAQDKGILRLRVHDLRDFTDDRHRSVDDAPFGGGPGMVMKAEPFFRAVEAIGAQPAAAGGAVVLRSPRGRRFDQATARRCSCLERLVLLCGRYEGIDERVRTFVDEELSLGDFVLTGGEAAARQPWRSALGVLHETLGEAMWDLDVVPVADVHPHVPASRADRLDAWVQHGDRGIVRVYLARGPHTRLHRRHERGQRGGDVGHPAAQRRTR